MTAERNLANKGPMRGRECAHANLIRDKLMKYVAYCLKAVFGVVLLAGSAHAQEANQAVLHEKLVAAVQKVVDGFDGVMGVAIKDLTSGQEIRISDELIFPTGSSIKLPILITLEKQAAEGRYRLTDQRKVMNKDEVQSGVLQFFGDGTSSFSLHDLAVMMIRNSDNTATNMLIDQVGMTNVNRTLDELGLTQIRLRRKMIDQKASGRGDENVASPRAALKMLEMLHRNQVVSEAVSQEVLKILKIPKVADPFRRALPSTVEVASKPGHINGVWVDWAIVYARNRPFAIVLMTNYGGDGVPEEFGRIEKLAYDHFARLGQSTVFGARVPYELLPTPR